MKKFLLGFLTAIILLNTIILLNDNKNLYNVSGKIIDRDLNNCYTIVLHNGEIFDFSSSKNYTIGQIVRVKIDNNGTPDDYVDDIIIKSY